VFERVATHEKHLLSIAKELEDIVLDGNDLNESVAIQVVVVEPTRVRELTRLAIRRVRLTEFDVGARRLESK
jgi:hypothetical protein